MIWIHTQKRPLEEAPAKIVDYMIFGSAKIEGDQEGY